MGNITVPANQAELDHVSRVASYVQIVLYSLIIIVGTLGNLLTMISIFVNKKLQTIPNVYVACLSATDFVVCAISAPSLTAALILDSPTSDELCQVFGPLNLYCMAQSMYNLVHIAINRYILVTKTSDLYMKLYTKRNVLISIIVTLVYGLFVILPPFLGYGKYGWSIKLNGCFLIAYDRFSKLYYTTALLPTCFLPCSLISSYCYFRIIQHYRQSRKKVSDRNLTLAIPKGQRSYGNTGSVSVGPAENELPAGQSTTASSSVRPLTDKRNSKQSTGSDDLLSEMPVDNGPVTVSTDNTLPVPVSCAGSKTNVRDRHNSLSLPHNERYNEMRTRLNKENQDKKSFKVVSNLLTVSIVFVLCWLPCAAGVVGDYYDTIPAIWNNFFMIIAFFNSTVNVFIFAGMNKAFRKTYIKIITCRWRHL